MCIQPAAGRYIVVVSGGFVLNFWNGKFMVRLNILHINRCIIL